MAVTCRHESLSVRTQERERERERSHLGFLGDESFVIGSARRCDDADPRRRAPRWLGRILHQVSHGMKKRDMKISEGDRDRDQRYRGGERDFF